MAFLAVWIESHQDNIQTKLTRIIIVAKLMLAVSKLFKPPHSFSTLVTVSDLPFNVISDKMSILTFKLHAFIWTYNIVQVKWPQETSYFQLMYECKCIN